MRKCLSLALFIILSAVITSSFGQSTNDISERSSVKDRIYTGGGLSMSFGNAYSYVTVAPMIGYRISNELSVGTAFSYRYRKDKIYDLTLNDYGINPFIRYNVFTNYFLQAEYEYLNYELALINSSTYEIFNIRKNFSSVLVGGGVSQPIGSRAFFNLTVLYNLSYVASDPYSPYSSPLVIRGGLSFGF
jgi:hypothetical protein